MASILNQKARLQPLDEDKPLILIEEEIQRSGLPERSILKNHAKTFSHQQSVKAILQGGVNMNQLSTQKASRHVSFAENDGIVRLESESSQTVQSFKLQKAGGLDMGCVEPTGIVEKSSTTKETCVSEDVSIRMEKEVCARTAKEQLTRSVIDSTTFTKQNNDEELFSRSIASERSTLHCMNKFSFDSGLKDMTLNAIHACTPGFFFMPPEGNCNSPNIKLMQNSSDSTREKLIKDIKTLGSICFPMCSKDIQETYNEAMPSHLSDREKGTDKLSQAFSESTTMKNAPLQFQMFPHLSPDKFLHSSSSSVGRRGQNCLNDDF